MNKYSNPNCTTCIVHAVTKILQVALEPSN